MTRVCKYCYFADGCHPRGCPGDHRKKLKAVDYDKFGRSVCPCGYAEECPVHCGNGHETAECLPEYESPFLSPPPKDEPQCDDPQWAYLYPVMHCNYGTCLFHYKHRERKGKMPARPADPKWRAWYEYREIFATATTDNTDPELLEELREGALVQMLNQVTETSPPYAPVKVKDWKEDFPLLSTPQKITILLLAIALIIAFCVTL